MQARCDIFFEIKFSNNSDALVRIDSGARLIQLI